MHPGFHHRLALNAGSGIVFEMQVGRVVEVVAAEEFELCHVGRGCGVEGARCVQGVRAAGISSDPGVEGILEGDLLLVGERPAGIRRRVRDGRDNQRAHHPDDRNDQQQLDERETSFFPAARPGAHKKPASQEALVHS